MAPRRLPTGTVSQSSRGERARPRSDESATGESSPDAATADELARENRRLARENRRLRERLEAERNERQAVIDRYEGLVDDCDAPRPSESGSGPRRSRPAGAGASGSLSSVLDRLARVLGLR